MLAPTVVARGGVLMAMVACAEPARAEQAEPLAAWIKGEGFRVQSPDGNWRLRVGLQVAPFYQPTFQENSHDWSNFGFAYVRPRLSGSFFRPWLEYLCSLEFKSFPPFLLDCFVAAKQWSFFRIRGGQFSTPLSRHEYRGPPEVLFPDFAATADYFWTGRDRGVQVYGETQYVDYFASFTAGTTLTQPISTPGNFQVVGRVTVHPLGAVGATEMPFITSEGPVPFRFSFTAQGAYGRVNPNGVGSNPDAFIQPNQQGEHTQGIGSCDLLVQWARFELFGEFYWRHVEPRNVPTPSFDQNGAWVQAHVTFFRRVLDFGVRFNWINPSASLANDRFVSGEAQLAWFIAENTLALRVRYGLANQQNPGPAPAVDPSLFNTVGLPITPGTEHVATLQLQIAL